MIYPKENYTERNNINFSLNWEKFGERALSINLLTYQPKSKIFCQMSQNQND